MSILGTLGPLVQGSSSSRSARLRTTTIFGGAFVVGAVATFAIVAGLGALLGLAGLPMRWRLAIAAAGFLGLAAFDVVAMVRSTYCPIGWRRQTPKSLVRRHPVDAVAALWGLDTGLAVTTFRVAAVTWGALLLAGLGLSAWWAGLAYGLGYAVPFLTLLWVHRVGRCARSRLPADPGLESLLGRRRAAQGVSALLLVAAGGLLMGGLAAAA